MIWLHATTGRGPDECQAALMGIVMAIQVDAMAFGLTYDLLETEDAPHGYSSALMAIDGDDAEAFGKTWNGTMQWLCKSFIRPNHKRKRWFIKISMMMVPPKLAEISQADLTWESMKASGPGGQHVNKTESAVRLTHKPTGIAVTAQEERSQHRNKSLALAKLYSRIADINAETARDVAQDRWDDHNTLERGGAIRTFEGPKFKQK
jgi:peptide chain release factor